MITLKKITIEGYKSIAKAEVELRDLNVIVGANGSGKSNFLTSTQLIFKALTQSGNFELFNANNLLHHGSKSTSKIRGVIETNHLEYVLLLEETSGALYPSNETVSSDVAKDKKLVLASRETSNFAELASSKLLVQESIRSFGQYHFHDTTDTSPAKSRNDLHDNRYFRPDAANLAAYLYRLKVNHPHEFSRIEDCIRLVAPYFEHFILEPQEIKGGFIKLEWKQKNSDAYFDAYSLSDGTLRFICLATLLMQPEPPALILLDEPELGLHPYAIALLAEMLASAATKSQLIIATQSVTLLNWMRPEDIIVAEHDGLATTFNRPNIETLTPWLEDFSMGDIWEKNLIGGRP